MNLYQLSSSKLVNKKVSHQSYWHDDKWVFDESPAGYKGGCLTIKWSVVLHNGSNLLDKQYEHLLDAAKRFIWSLKVDPPPKSNFASPLTLVSRSHCLFDLVRWMIANSYDSFSEIDSTACENYWEYVCQTRNKQFEGNLTKETLARYLQTLVYLYRQRNKLRDAVQEEPFGGQSLYRKAKQFGIKNGWIPYIPDQIALASLQHSWEWIEWRSEDIIRLLQMYLAASKINVRGQRVYNSKYRNIKEFEFSSYPGSSSPWNAKIAGARQIRMLVDNLVDACANTCFGTVGMRVHELLGLEVGCVEIVPSIDGLLEVFYLVGRTSKTGEQSVRWVAGARLTGTHDVPPAVKAVQILEKIFAPWREKSESSKLFLELGVGNGFPMAKQQLSGLSVAAINKRLDKFNQKYVALPSEWHFTSHQWRKTLARFVAMVDKSALSALSQHFLHLSIAMTDRGYIGNDFELEELIDGMVRAETADILIQVLLQGRPVAGRMGEQLIEKHTALKAHFRGMTIKDAKEEIQWIIEDSSMSIHSCEWGWCMYRQETSQCEGSQKGPDYAKRGPSVCAGCSNLMIEEKHIPWWQDRLDKNLALLTQLSNAGASELQKAPVQARIRECQHIINMFNLSREKLNAKTQ